MSGYIRRKSYFSVNRYQMPIIGLALIPTFIFCSLLSVFVLFTYDEFAKYFHPGISVEKIQLFNQNIFFILVTIWTFFIVVYAWARIVSGKLVGPIERITRELDRVIEGENVERIYARDNDYVSTGLLPRINYLIKMNRTAQTAAAVSLSTVKI
ncbi:MAG: hypothetical protein KBD53_07080 [Candidatus Omnitrophica bacterium]|nr:hypothetical protein [Candidatus Omnitrophota bacterium]